MTNLLRLVLRVILGALLCVSAISKLSSIGSFELYLFSFHILSFDAAALLSRLLIVCEFLLGLGLVSGFFRKLVNGLCAAMLAGFSAFLVWRLTAGDEASCHCFGELVEMNPLQSLLKNGAFALLLAGGWKAADWTEVFPKLPDWMKNFKLRLASTLAVAAISLFVVFAFWPPALWWRLIGHSSNDLVEEKWAPYSHEFKYDEGRQVVLFVSPLCKHCQNCIAKVNAMIERHSLPKAQIHEVFMIVTTNPDDMERLIPYFYEKAGIADPELDFKTLPSDEFIPMTDGLMPLICLFEDGRLVKEYSNSTLDEKAFADFLLGR